MTMVSIRKASNGNYYLYKVTSGNKRGRWSKGDAVRNWWLLKARSITADSRTNLNNRVDTLKFGAITFPEELIGKRIRFKIEIIDEPIQKPVVRKCLGCELYFETKDEKINHCPTCLEKQSEDLFRKALGENKPLQKKIRKQTKNRRNYLKHWMRDWRRKQKENPKKEEQK